MLPPEPEEGALSTVFNVGSGRRSRLPKPNGLWEKRVWDGIRNRPKRGREGKPAQTPHEPFRKVGAGRRWPLSRVTEGIHSPGP
jgi:hypothetical protein